MIALEAGRLQEDLARPERYGRRQLLDQHAVRAAETRRDRHCDDVVPEYDVRVLRDAGAGDRIEVVVDRLADGRNVRADEVDAMDDRVGVAVVYVDLAALQKGRCEQLREEALVLGDRGRIGRVKLQREQLGAARRRADEDADDLGQPVQPDDATLRYGHGGASR
jgi:hypothetical protein